MKPEVKLCSLSAHFADASCTGTEGDQRIYGFVEEVWDAICEYQVSARPPSPVGQFTDISVSYVLQQKIIYEQNLSIGNLCTSPFNSTNGVPLGFQSDSSRLGLIFVH